MISRTLFLFIDWTSSSFWVLGFLSNRFNQLRSFVSKVYSPGRLAIWAESVFQSKSFNCCYLIFKGASCILLLLVFLSQIPPFPFKSYILFLSEKSHSVEVMQLLFSICLFFFFCSFMGICWGSRSNQTRSFQNDHEKAIGFCLTKLQANLLVPLMISTLFYSTVSSVHINFFS